MESFIFHLRIAMPCGHLFISPIFFTIIFISKETPAFLQYSNGDPRSPQRSITVKMDKSYSRIPVPVMLAQRLLMHVVHSTCVYNVCLQLLMNPLLQALPPPLYPGSSRKKVQCVPQKELSGYVRSGHGIAIDIIEAICKGKGCTDGGC